MTNYYNALYAFKISKATLYRAIGREVIEWLKHKIKAL
jgi:hypothetical protein